MFNENFEIISSENIRWLDNLPQYSLDGITRGFIEGILKDVFGDHPGGLVYKMSVFNGASHDEAMLAGSVSELLYAWNKNFDRLNEDFMLINKSPPLDKYRGMICFTDLIRQRILDSPILCDKSKVVIMKKLSDCFMSVLSRWNQEFEARKEKYISNWDSMIYNHMACDTLGRIFGFCMWLSSSIKEIFDKSICENWGQYFGSLMQIVNDYNTNNTRIIILSDFDKEALKIVWDYRKNIVENFQFPDSDAGEFMKLYSDRILTISKIPKSS